MKMMLIVADTYAEAEQIARFRFWDWMWFASVEIALDWLQRCMERGVQINAVIRDTHVLTGVAA